MIRKRLLDFSDRLAASVREKGNPCVVGIDPVPDLLPRGMRPRSCKPKENARRLLAFAKRVLDVVAPRIPAIKIQIAFFERFGPVGFAAYQETVAYARKLGLITIGDVKRGDIGSTAEAYAEAHLGLGAEFPDAITVNPLFGSDGMKPFLDRARERGKGLFILAQTSNPSAAEIQGLTTEDGDSVSEKISDLISRWGKDRIGRYGFSSVGAVVGATKPQAIAALRKKMPQAWLLLPGYGAQGGKAAELAPAFGSDGLGALISSSRGIIYAYLDPRLGEGRKWTEACATALDEMILEARAAALRK